MGISQLKLGDELNARKSFINARLLAGRVVQANQWLKYIGAAPATESELKRISGPCRPQNRNLRYEGTVAESSITNVTVAQVNTKLVNNEVNEVDVKTVPRHEFYWVSAKVDTEKMSSQLRSLVTPLSINLVRGGGSIDGPLHLFFDGIENNLATVAAGKLSLKVGFPVRGKPRPKARYRTTQMQEFKCTYLEFTGNQNDLKQVWEKLYRDTLSAGHKLSGSSRQILRNSNNTLQINTELQLGIL